MEFHGISHIYTMQGKEEACTVPALATKTLANLVLLEYSQRVPSDDEWYFVRQGRLHVSPGVTSLRAGTGGGARRGEKE